MKTNTDEIKKGLYDWIGEDGKLIHVFESAIKDNIKDCSEFIDAVFNNELETDFATEIENSVQKDVDDYDIWYEYTSVYFITKLQKNNGVNRLIIKLKFVVDRNYDETGINDDEYTETILDIESEDIKEIEKYLSDLWENELKDLV